MHAVLFPWCKLDLKKHGVRGEKVFDEKGYLYIYKRSLDMLGSAIQCGETWKDLILASSSAVQCKHENPEWQAVGNWAK